MSTDGLTDAEHHAIAELKHLAERWPPSLKLVSMSGDLHVIRERDWGTIVGEGSAEVRQECILADINGIPNDGGAW